ncbi:MAG TPA: class I SAM-dependent methyltransferase [Anaerolineales bacterium]|jgi:SAM-dependent methyltransferase|nr:class I SAM-dependent methyltransferase [Anaerolineales bacterium]
MHAQVETAPDADVRQQVREFYDNVGWREVSEGLYQNARYEDLRPVAREYVHRCHLRVLGHLAPKGRFLLDAGSGPIQYPEYLEYSRGYQARVCVDISLVALQEARRRIGDLQGNDHGLFVVADIARLPFGPEVFDGVVSLHTIHHLPEKEHIHAYSELYRVLSPERTGVVVNGWDDPPLMELFDHPIRWANRLRWYRERVQWPTRRRQMTTQNTSANLPAQPKGTYVSKNDAVHLIQTVGQSMPLQILVWRSVSVRFMRALIHLKLGGKGLLRILFWLEERFPEFFGRNGQYPLIVIRKPGRSEVVPRSMLGSHCDAE